jgi:hypothetical protein
MLLNKKIILLAMTVLTLSCAASKNVPVPEKKNPGIEFYSAHGPSTNPGSLRAMLGELPDSLFQLVAIVQNSTILPFFASQQGIKVTKENADEDTLHTVLDMLKALQRKKQKPIVYTRKPEEKLRSESRNIAVLLCSLLREKGIPARARPGFVSYMVMGKYTDHWICEYWNKSEDRWVQVDASLDSAQRIRLGADFSPLDIPFGKVVFPGAAWLLCAQRKLDQDIFGNHQMGTVYYNDTIIKLSGYWYIKDHIIRDLLALNKLELTSWEGNDLMGPEVKIDRNLATMLQTAAELTVEPDKRFEELRSFYESMPDLKIMTVKEQ